MKRHICIAMVAALAAASLGACSSGAGDNSSSAEAASAALGDSIAVADSLRQEARIDSLLAAFTTPDLVTLQLKGFVKKVTVTMAEPDSGSDTYTFDFDSLGHLHAATIPYRMEYQEGQSSPAAIGRDNDGRIVSIRATRRANGMESNDALRFSYNSAAMPAKVTLTGCGFECDHTEVVTFVYADSSTDGWPVGAHTTDSWSAEGYYGDTKGTLSAEYQTCDDQGNWTRCLWTGTEKTSSGSEFEGPDPDVTKGVSRTFTRTILYYTPSREQIRSMLH